MRPEILRAILEIRSIISLEIIIFDDGLPYTYHVSLELVQAATIVNVSMAMYQMVMYV